ncbi:killer cell lectin-like receptor subfamily G member 2 isoform X1 [Artibeus jamaicensis]|uniref:killer cell lectin-like receptor subfamily G member 2 isoform X1 n=1 Tax=Artibeus jamaicensis TaxID=9417 RepID=UPI00235AB000|nr:killer cell lectin-like receptor subfamily G member 2 isoform X1 [Artibeus jamaicensis]
MERARAASGGDQVRAELPMETLENQVPGLEQPQAPAEEPPESPENSLAPAVHQATGAGQDFSGGKKLPSPHPARLRVLPPSLGYGAFRRQVSASPEPPSPGPAAAEQPRDREAELVPWAAPVELQVDVRVKPVGAAGGSRAPSPAPSTRFITVPVPESPGFSRHASPVFPILPRTASLGSTWGRGSQLAVARAEHGLDAEGRVDPAEGDAESPGSPKCRCRCKEQELEKEDTVLLHRAQVDGDLKLHRAIKLIGLPMYMKSLRWALVVMAVLLAVSTVAIIALASRTGARCRPCPQGWLWYGEHCYHLSAEAQAWKASQAYCSALNATLALLSHSQDFLSRCLAIKYSWVGAQRGPHGWHWIDGTPLSPPLVPEEEEGRPDLRCGAVDGGKLVALDCSSPRPCICAKGAE